MSEEIPPKDQKILNNLYLAILISFILTLVPAMAMSIVSMILLVVLLIAAYVVRNHSAEDGLAHHHARYIIRTSWIGGVYALAFTLIASAYMVPNIDYTPFQPCADTMVHGAIPQNDAEIMKQAQPCYDAFIEKNQNTITIAMLISAVPLFLFFFYRFGKGFWLARQGLRVTNIKNWLL